MSEENTNQYNEKSIDMYRNHSWQGHVYYKQQWQEEETKKPVNNDKDIEPLLQPRSNKDTKTLQQLRSNKDTSTLRNNRGHKLAATQE